jgi:hypothetical protein
MKEYEGAAEAFRAAISFNPHFPKAHSRLATLLEKQLGDIESAREHRQLAGSMRDRGVLRLARAGGVKPAERATVVPMPQDGPMNTRGEQMPPLAESLIVVTGLPRSGTSLLLEMLAAGGVSVETDGLREADEDNPRGYFEFEPVKNLLSNSGWLLEARGRAIKIVAPLLEGLPPSVACRVILCERNLDEVLDSQDRMLWRHNAVPAATPERRRRLRDEYGRTLDRAKAMLRDRPGTRLLVIEHGVMISDPLVAAARINNFLDGGLDVEKMAGAVETTLYRNRR